jgi:hypothetical protein
MALPTCHQRTLETIAARLADSDPRLNSLFAIFTRLNHAEAMPWLEQLKVRPVRDRLVRIQFWFRLLARRPAGRMRAVLLLPAALTAMACALTLGLGLAGGGHRSPPGSKSPSARELVVKPKLCRLPVLRMPALSC